MTKKSDDQFSKKESARRFEAALKGARLVKRDNDTPRKPATGKKRR
jgi:hypothetical protein